MVVFKSIDTNEGVTLKVAAGVEAASETVNMDSTKLKAATKEGTVIESSEDEGSDMLEAALVKSTMLEAVTKVSASMKTNAKKAAAAPVKEDTG